jgi:hypothetical protein
MSFGDFLGRVTTILERIGLEYMVVGSLASTFHGVTRATQDIDIVVVLGQRQVRTLLDAFPPEQYYISETAARDAVRRRSQFNIIDMDTGWKADFVIQKQRPFSGHEMERRTRVTLMGHQLHIATAEDTIIAKLEWARVGQSERQLRDVAGILEVKGAALDTQYIDHWIAELGLEEIWERARSATAKGKA